MRKTGVWKDVSGELDNILAGHLSILLTNNNDGTITLDVALATTSNKGLMSSADKTTLDNRDSANTASTLVERDANGDFSAGVITADSVTINNAPVAGSDAVNKTYVDNLVSSGIRLLGVIDASTNPNYPSGVLGDSYHISVDGKIGGVNGEVVKNGDLIIAIGTTAGGDEASVGDDWIIVERNLDYATAVVAGYVRLATPAEAITGTNTTAVITPEGLAAALAAVNAAGKFESDIGDGVIASFVVNHALNTIAPHVQVKDNSTLLFVTPDIELTDANNVTITFTPAIPASNSYKVIVQG
jgi:hypothetical protein